MTNQIHRLPAPEQLAAGESMLAESSTPAIRWYQFDPPALLLGSGQPISDIDHDACKRAGIGVYRRGSGGGAVLGRDLLLLDVALPRGHALFRADVTESYRWLGMVWCEALHSLGLDAALAEIAHARGDTRGLDALLRRVCFGGLSPYEVLVGGRKVVGLAQRRRYGGALFQAAVYRHWEARATAELIAATPDQRERLTAQLHERVIGLDRLGVSPPAVLAAVDTALRAAIDIAGDPALKHRAKETNPAEAGYEAPQR